MPSPRHLALVSLSVALLAACADNDFDLPPGSGGRIEAPKPAATSSTGGAAGASAGGTAAGGAAAGGTAAGGKASAGAGGAAAGAGGDAGSGGDAAGAGGEAGAGGSSAGAGGEAGAAGMAGEAGAGGSSAGAGGAGGAGQGGGGGTAGQNVGGAPTNGVDVTFDTFNVALAGAFVPNESARRQPIYDALAALESDIVCLQEVWEQSDKDAIVNAAKAKFPYFVSVQQDLDTALDPAFATNDGGTVPTAPDTAPCGAMAQKDKLNAGIDCLKANCSTIPNSEDGKTTSTACASSSCFSAVAGLVIGADNQRCYGCLAPNLPTKTFAQIRDICTTNPKAGLAFDGQNGVVLLSKHPLDQVETVVVPGTWNRRIFMRATATLPNNAKVDVYCNHLTPILVGATYPYTGLYPEGPETNKWANEQLLQAKKLVSYVETKSGTTPAVILGDFNASRGYTKNSVSLVDDEGPKTLDQLETSFTPGIAQGYEPSCTYCPSVQDANNSFTLNLNVGPTDKGAPTWLDLIYLKNISQGAVLSSQRTFTEATVDGVDSTGAAAKVPLSDHFGFRSVIRIADP